MTPAPPAAAESILAELRRRAVEVRVEGNRIRWRPASAAADLADAIRAEKPQLLALLGSVSRKTSERERELLRLIAQAVAEAAEEPRWPSVSELPNLPVNIADLVRRREGWTPKSWAARLSTLADACEFVNPSRAAELRAAVDVMSRTYRKRRCQLTFIRNMIK